MMRSMFSAVTGLRNHQTMMDVIGNNIANVNTVGFKKSRVTFQDALYQTIKGASSAQGNRGGTNPMQVGLGMTVASIDTLHTPSSLEATGNMTDLAIEGDGFFILSDGQNYYYTRAGNFGFDEEGNLVSTSNGLKVMGWQGTADKTPQNITSIRIQKGMMMPAKATGEVRFAKNLDASAPVELDKEKGYKIPFKVYDSLGNSYELLIIFNKTDVNKWEYTVIPYSENIDYQNLTSNGTLIFDPIDGDLFDQNNEPFQGSEIKKDINVTLSNGTSLSFKVDFSYLTQYAKETTVDLSYHDGYAAGTLLGISVDSKGVITGVFDNGQNMELAQVALAVFDNPAGLTKAGGNTYTASNNSGEVQIGMAGTGGRGTISPGSLEMSNVDLAEEFTRMIVTQRGFQANSRIISVADEMLQELVNIKR
ncbi:Flagellar hook protein FlgE [Fervidicola ferrireducens]|uniref:Flagellar hook protein FlgE n=1 Tax=Fervidicola ferrireducens TaxID=520764 RepID=A0A140LAP1_9FIRM|nr:flagellar hook protein FlgE [Fervidicola ferrireducens]KXG77616.1 Flagellar hook protein FlgE [Fervidicola ferrireducens]